jgi:hypothetical protein
VSGFKQAAVARLGQQNIERISPPDQGEALKFTFVVTSADVAAAFFVNIAVES